MQTLIIAGNVGKDAELRTLQSGEAVLNFSVAVDNGKDREGSKRPPTWFDCAVWGKRAESLQSYIKKGTKLTLSGRPGASAHDGKAYLQLTVNELTFMSSAHSGGSSGGQSSGYDDAASGKHNDAGGYGGAGAASGGRSGFDDSDEIPF